MILKLVVVVVVGSNGFVFADQIPDSKELSTVSVYAQTVSNFQRVEVGGFWNSVKRHLEKEKITNAFAPSWEILNDNYHLLEGIAGKYPGSDFGQMLAISRRSLEFPTVVPVSHVYILWRQDEFIRARIISIAELEEFTGLSELKRQDAYPIVGQTRIEEQREVDLRNSKKPNKYAFASPKIGFLYVLIFSALVIASIVTYLFKRKI